MNRPDHLVDPVDRSPLTPVDGGLRGGGGRFYPEAAGGWDLRPADARGAREGDANKALQADIYDAKLGELTDFEHPHNLMLVHERKLLDKLPVQAGDRVLEIGGHRSGALAYLERRKGVVGTGADIAQVWVRAQNAAARARGGETRWVVADAENLPFADASFAAVVAFDVLEHVTHLDRAVSGIFRVLKPGGTLVAHMPVQDIGGSLDGLQRWWDAADYAARQAGAGHFHERMPTRLQMRTLLESVGFQVEDVESFNVWLQPLHDHKWMALLGKVRHRGKAERNAPDATPGDGAPAAPRVGASAFQKAYARVAVPLARVLTTPDKLGSLLGIGGSASFVARRPA